MVGTAMSLISSLINVGMAPGTAMGMVYTAGAHSTGMLMENAVQNERFSQITSQASLEQNLVLILSTGAAGAAKGE